MALPQQKFREMVFQVLYCHEFSNEVEDTVDLFMQELKVTKKSVQSALERVEKIRAHIEEIDGKIRATSTEYQFERISSVEKNILRLGIFELCYDEGVPPLVAIAEAIRLARKFGTPESARFVNAIMDGIYQGSLCASKSKSPENC